MNPVIKPGNTLFSLMGSAHDYNLVYFLIYFLKLLKTRTDQNELPVCASLAPNDLTDLLSNQSSLRKLNDDRTGWEENQKEKETAMPLRSDNRKV